MNPRGLIYRLPFFGILLLFLVSVSSSAYAVESSVTVSQEVVNNSSGGGGGGGGGVGGVSPTPSPAPSPTPSPTPEPGVEELPPSPQPEILPEVPITPEVPIEEPIVPNETAGIGDLNGDGVEDNVGVNQGSGAISVTLSNTDGTMGNTVDYPIGGDLNIITSADLNGDGSLDLVVSNNNPNSVSVLLNNGDGTFVDAVDYLVNVTPIATLNIEDINSDGFLDISINIGNPSNSALLLNNGDGTFTLSEDGLNETIVGTGDLNRDTFGDAVILNPESGTVSVTISNGDGTFSPAVDYPVGSNPNSINLVGDVNNDGYIDILVTNADSNTVSVLVNYGDGTFADAVEYAVGQNPNNISVGDLNGDGVLDMVVANIGSNSLSILINNGDGTFSEAVDYPIDASPISRVVIEDVNNDNLLDISVNRGVSLNTAILLNNGDGTFTLAGALEELLLLAEDAVEMITDISVAIVENTGEIVRSPAGRVVTAITQPVGVVSGGVAIGSQVLISTATVTSFSDIYLLLVRGLGLLLGLFRKKRKPWGTVYDSVTKRPLDPAYVTITKDGVEISDAITDLDGRFGFFVPPGKYTLTAGKTNYSFPSKNLAGKDKDELYDSLYQGDEVENKEGEVVMRNIPLDPVTFDWNEFQKNKQNLFRLYSEKEKRWKIAFDYVYKIGFLGALLAAIFNGNYLNYTFVIFYALINIYQTFFIAKRTAVALKYAGTNEPIPYSIVKLFSAEAGNQVKSVVSDHLGRFYLLVGPGKYYMTVDAKLPDASYKTIYKSEVMDLKDGIVPSDVIINP